MAKFTAGADLNIKWANHSFVGVAGTTHRVADALVEEFTAEVAPQVPGFAWVTQDEISAIATLPIGQTDVTGLTAALAAKYDKTGGTISGSATVTGTLSAGATTTGALVVQGAASVTGTLSAGAATTGPLQVDGAIIGTSTLVVTSGITAASLSATGTVRAGNNLNVTNTITGTDLSLTGKLTFAGVMQAGGTAFPGSPVNNDLFYRTDLDLLFFYDGTRWLSTTLYRDTYRTQNLAATGNEQMVNPASALGSGNVWAVSLDTVFFVSGGTALGASHKWVGIFAPLSSANVVGSAITTINIDSGSSSVWRRDNQTISALIPFNISTHPLLVLNWTKTGTPGNLFAVHHLLYRVVGV